MMERLAQIIRELLEKFAVIYHRYSTPTTEPVSDNVESSDILRGLRDRARNFGWPESRIRIIVDKLSVSSSRRGLHPGFQQMLHLIESGEVIVYSGCKPEQTDHVGSDLRMSEEPPLGQEPSNPRQNEENQPPNNPTEQG